jgi:hypothetical protein
MKSTITVYDVATGEAQEMSAIDALVAKYKGSISLTALKVEQQDAQPVKRRTYKRRDMQPEQTEEMTPSDDAA